MTSSQTVSNVVCKGLRCLGLPKDQVLPMVNQVGSWLANNGTQWTINRLKDIKLVFINNLNGSDYKTSTWMKLDSKGYPLGPFKVLFDQERSMKNIRKNPVGVKLLSGYSFLRSYPGTVE